MSDGVKGWEAAGKKGRNMFLALDFSLSWSQLGQGLQHHNFISLLLSEVITSLFSNMDSPYSCTHPGVY